MVRFFAALLVAGSLAFYIGKHFDRQFADTNSFQSPFAPMKAGFR